MQPELQFTAHSELCFTSAAKLARMIRTRKVSATEVMRAFIAQIERVNPRVNAIVTFLPERALKDARALDRRLANRRTASEGPLAGLPIAGALFFTGAFPVVLAVGPAAQHAVQLVDARRKAQAAQVAPFVVDLRDRLRRRRLHHRHRLRPVLGVARRAARLHALLLQRVPLTAVGALAHPARLHRAARPADKPRVRLGHAGRD